MMIKMQAEKAKPIKFLMEIRILLGIRLKFKPVISCQELGYVVSMS